jgi:hypothetical protein
MSVPVRIDSAALLLSLDPPAWFLRHPRAVAEVAGWLGARIVRQGVPLDLPLVEAAALLHDVDKLPPEDDPASAIPHGEGSAVWLASRGYPELGRAVAAHPVTRLLDGERHRRWAAFASREERVVAYADKRAGQRLESMDARFASWRRRYPHVDDDPSGPWRPESMRLVRMRAARLEADVCRAAAIRPNEVRRLRWTARAIRAAAARRAAR